MTFETNGGLGLLMARRGGPAIDIRKLIDELESLVEESYHFMNFSWGLDREEFFKLTNKLRASLPDEVRKAVRVTAESEKIIGGAREAAEQTLVDAQNEAKLSLQSAQAQSEKLVREAEGRAQARVQEAEAYAKKAIAEAHAQAEHAVSDSEVMRLATAQAREIIHRAEREARDMRRGGEEFAREELARLEKVLGEAHATVQRGRGKLDQRLGAHESAAPPSGGSGGSRASAPMNGEMVGARR